MPWEIRPFGFNPRQQSECPETKNVTLLRGNKDVFTDEQTSFTPLYYD